MCRSRLTLFSKKHNIFSSTLKEVKNDILEPLRKNMQGL